MMNRILLAVGVLACCFSNVFGQSEIYKHEYWIDDNYEKKVVVSSAKATQEYTIDLSALPIGIHYFNHRTQNADGAWGAMTRNVFYLRNTDEALSESASPIIGYEYWVDDDYDKKKYVASSNTESSIIIDLSSYSEGTHHFNFRAQNADGKWGAATRDVFYLRKSDADLSETLSPLAGYEYWIDDDYEGKTYKKSSSSTVVASIPLNDLKSGVHCLNFRSHNDEGRWGAMTRNLFYLHEPGLASDEGAKIIGYRYKFNDKSTYVAINPCSEYSLSNKILSLPDYEDFASLDEGCKYEFTPSQIRLCRENIAVFSLQFENELHKWSNPANLEINVKDTLDRRVTELRPQSSVTLDKVKSGDFNAIKIDIAETNNYYFKATQPCRIDLYAANGELYQTLKEAELLTLGEAGLMEGTYYGVVRDHKTDSVYTDSSVTIRMLLTEGLTPDPEFSFADSLLTIKSMDGAKIYYTLDGSTPTTNSTLYKEAVKVLSNCTAKAIAKHPDLAVSDVSTYKIDYYKVALPEVLFANLKLYMSCSTPDTRLYFTVDGTDPTEKGTLYTEPVSINYNCTVKVVGKREGYNDSDILEYALDVENVRCVAPVFIRDGNTLTLSSLTEGATFYYTLDGEDPTATYVKYDGVISLTHNSIVKAYAVKDGLLNSETVSFTVDWFKAASPEFDIVDNCIVMVCTTENAVIYYTTDGNVPDETSKKYESPVSMTESMVVKAIAYSKNFNPSDVVTLDAENLRCIMPVFTMADNILAITSTTEGASIYYTLDGTTPTKESNLYDKGIKLTENCVVKAFATKQGRANSHVADYIVNWFQVETPMFTLDGHLLSITSETPNVEIYYTIGGDTPDKSAEKYVSPIELTDNKIVKAIAYAEHFNDSEVSEFIPDVFVCDDVHMIYNGRYVALESGTEGSTIYYTINGSTPSVASDVYREPIDINGLATVKAFAVKPDFNEGAISTFAADYYYNGIDVLTSKHGVLSKAFEWSGTENVSELNVVGNINGDDVAFLASISSLKHLNIEETDVEDNSLSANAFAGSGIVCISLPKTIERVGSSLFAGCQNIAAIQWNSSRSLPSSAMSGLSNPNLLLYVKINSLAPSNVTNVITSDYAENIILTDGEGNTNFYCPRPFTAKSISYRHNYSMKTQIGTCQGWETIALPFDVQTITHSKNGEIAPFAANNATAKPFWMYSLGNYGFEMADKIKANIPYIISMPNNDEYADEYILDGDVTFSAENVKVPVTEEKVLSKGEFLFIPTTVKIAQNSNVYVINKNEEYNGQLPGSMFVPDLRSVSPFEGYLALASEINRPAMVRLKDIGFDDDISGIVNLKKQSGLQIWGAAGSIHIRTDRERTVTVYSVSGSLVKTVDLNVGENVINGIDAGVYIVEHTPVFVK